jgi:hypothetical protein
MGEGNVVLATSEVAVEAAKSRHTMDALKVRSQLEQLKLLLATLPIAGNRYAFWRRPSWNDWLMDRPRSTAHGDASGPNFLMLAWSYSVCQVLRTHSVFDWKRAAEPTETIRPVACRGP